MAEFEEISVTDLILDGKNPRFEGDNEASNRKCIERLLEEDRNGVIELAKDIVELGAVNPSDLPIVLPENDEKVVLEGNRRIAALKLLARPDLAPEAFVKEFERIGDGAEAPPKVWCLIVENRDEAKPWLERKHIRDNGGKGVVHWTPKQQQRFSPSRNQSGIATQVLDAATAIAGNDHELAELVAAVDSDRATSTVGRVLGTGYVKDKLGISFTDSGVAFQFSDESTVEAIKAVLRKLTGPNRLKSRDLNDRSDRIKLVHDIDQPSPKDEGQKGTSSDSDDAEREAGDTEQDSIAAEAPAKKGSRTTVEKRIFTGMKLHHVDHRTKVVLKEAQSIDIETHLNTSAVHLRVLLDLCLSELADLAGWTETALVDKATKAFREIDPNQSKGRGKGHENRKKELDNAFRVTSPDGAFSHRSLNAFVHNWSAKPNEEEVRRHSTGLAPFLKEVDQLIGKYREAESS